VLDFAVDHRALVGTASTDRGPIEGRTPIPPQGPPPADAVTVKVHLQTSPARVYEALATPEGRSSFWATSAEERDDTISFRFSNGMELQSRVLEREPGRRYAVTYFGDSVARFSLTPDHAGGTDLELTETGIHPDWWAEHRAGWVSVLLTLKAAVDFGVDLRNPHPGRDWDAGYADV
jgi:uncharacterized protein YndB with AHSA1/START domain